LTLPLRSGAHLRDYGSHEHPNATTPISTTWITPYLPAARPGVGGPTHDRPARRPYRALLPAANRLPVAPATPRVPAPGHRLPLLSCLERCGLGRWKSNGRANYATNARRQVFPFFMKQTSGRRPGKVPIPPDLMIREFPKYTSRIRARACAIPRRFTNSGGS
jgi:hypothetical protein